MVEVFNTIAPVFLLIGVGVILFRWFLDGTFLRGMNWMTYWVGIPALIFSALAGTDLAEPMAVRVVALFTLATLLTLALAGVVGRISGLPRASSGTYLQASFRGNLAFIGIPVVIFAYPENGGGGTLAILALGPAMVVYNVLSVVLLQRSRDGGGIVFKKLIGSLAGNPLILASAAGAAASLFDIGLPMVLARSVDVLGQMALPMALLSIGGVLATVRVRKGAGFATGASLLKLVACPAIGFLLAPLFGLEGDALGVTLILLATPTAAASYIIAQQMGGDESLASGAIVISTVLSLVSLSAVVALV